GGEGVSSRLLLRCASISSKRQQARAQPRRLMDALASFQLVRPTMNMHLMAQRLRAEGRDVIALVGGEPDYDTPDNIKDACMAAIRDNITRYPPGGGMMELRQALSRKFHDDNKLDYPPEQILVLAGTKPLLTAAALALADPGDEIIIPVPFWVSYPNIALM